MACQKKIGTQLAPIAEPKTPLPLTTSEKELILCFHLITKRAQRGSKPILFSHIFTSGQSISA
jgi:hypothetical protein